MKTRMHTPVHRRERVGDKETGRERKEKHREAKQYIYIYIYIY
jgi:hypothetical protein